MAVPPNVGGEFSTSLATQNADAVAITGGTIAGVTLTGATLTTGAFNGTVGATTPSSGAFTTLTASTGLTNTPITLKSTRVGTFVANGATPVTVSNTTFAITDAVIISLNTIGGTVGVQPHVATVTGASGFTVVCTASDTSTYNYALIATA